MNKESIGIHRTVSLHVLNYIPVMPSRPENSQWPLGFMTNRCRNTQRHIESEEQFTRDEKEVSRKILEWERGLDGQVKDIIQHESWKKQKAGKRSWFYPPVVIRAKAGTGKSILVGKIMAELIDAGVDKNQEQWPIFDRIVYSQLKDQTSENLRIAICNGMDGYHKCDSLDQFFESTSEVPDGMKILLIDSLDENSGREDWWSISRQLSDNGWKVIWTCRDPDWDEYNLEGKIDKEFTNYTTGTKHWDLLSSKTWELKLDSKRQNELDKGVQKNSIGSKNPELAHHFVNFCYSETQLMHLFYTNFDLQDEIRNKLDQNLIDNILLERNKIIEKYPDEPDFSSRVFYNDFFDKNLAGIIIRTALNLYRESTGHDVKSSWNRLCNRYFQLNHSSKRKSGILDESLPETEEEDSKLIHYLELAGILRNTEEGKKFRHRDFAMIAFVSGSPNGLEGLFLDKDVTIKDDILFKHFFPSEHTKNGEVVDDFLRRTGNVISHLDYLANPPKLSKLKHNVPRRALIKADRLPKPGPKEHKGLSESQMDALTLGANERAIVLHGVPGSGKTFTGVERIIVNQVRLFMERKTDQHALVVALNNELAHSISFELERQHSESPYLKGNIKQEESRHEIIKSIEVKSLEQLLIEWMPGFEKIKLIGDEKLKQNFRLLKSNLKFDVPDSVYRILQADYQGNMFHGVTGVFHSQKDYLGSNKGDVVGSLKDYFDNDERVNQIRIEWHRCTDISRANGGLPLNEACALLRNRIMKFEWYNEGHESKWTGDFIVETDHLKFDENESFTLFKQKFDSGHYDCIMVDEVQDLPAIAVNMLSFMAPYREPSKFILAGDQFQTINGQPFDWDLFLGDLTKMTTQLKEHCDTIIHPFNGVQLNDHLRGLYWGESSIKNVIDNRLNENHRNHKTINELTKSSWQNWPSRRYYETVKDSYPIEDMESMYDKRKELGADDDLLSEFTSVMIIDSKDSEDYMKKIEIILREINTRAGVSLLCTNQILRDYVDEQMSTDGSEDLRVETFDPWTIKGLERNAVVLLGSYTAARRDLDSGILWNANILGDVNESQARAIDLMRRKMLVSNTRAVDQLIILQSPKGDPFNLGKEKYTLKSLNQPDYEDIKSSDLIRIEKGAELKHKLGEFFRGSFITPQQISLKRISEGVMLKPKGVEKEYERFLDSLENILENDPQDSDLRDFLTSILISKPGNLNKHSLIYDILVPEDKHRTYNDGPPPENPEEFDMNNYSIMVENSKILTVSGPWIDDGFDRLMKVITQFNNLRANISETIGSFRMKYRRKPLLVDFIDDIERFGNSVLELLSDFAMQKEIPLDIDLIDESDVFAYLFSKHSGMDESDYQNVRDPSFALRILRSIRGMLDLDEQGNLFFITSTNNINWITFKQFREDLEKLRFDEFSVVEKNPIIQFAKDMIDIRDNVTPRHLAALPKQARDRIDEVYSFGVYFFIKNGQTSELNYDEQRKIETFISNEFPGMDTQRINEFLNMMYANCKSILNRIDDNKVLGWKISNFIEFIRVLLTDETKHEEDMALREKTPQEEKAEDLIYESTYINKILRDTIVNSSNFHDLNLPEDRVYEKEGYHRTLFNWIEKILESDETLSSQSKVNDLPGQLRRHLEDYLLLTKIGKEFDKSHPLAGDITSEIPLKEDFVKNWTTLLANLIVGKIRESISMAGSGQYDLGTDTKLNLLYLMSLNETYNAQPVALAKDVQAFPALQLTNGFEVVGVTSYPVEFMPRFSTERLEIGWRKAHSNHFVFPEQLDRKAHLELTDSFFQNLNVNIGLSDMLCPDVYPTGSRKIGWRFDGFGNLVDYNKWFNDNLEFWMFTKNANHDRSSDVYLLNEFNLKSRLQSYMKVVNAAWNYITNSKSATIGAKTLIQNIILDIYTHEELTDWGEKYVLGYRTQELSIKPNGKPLRYIYTRSTKKGELAPDGKSNWESCEIYSLLKQFIHFENDKFDKEDAITDLLYFKDLFEEFLNREQNEFESILENLVEIGAVSTDQESMEQLRNLSGISSKEKAATSDGSRGDKAEIDESAKFDENVRDWFNLTEQSWNNMSEAGRNSLRDTYSNNKRN